MIVPTLGFCDQEAPNVPVVAASEAGDCYAKSVPSGSYGDAGTTTVFRVKRGVDEVIEVHEWFSWNIHLFCDLYSETGPNKNVVVRFGPWPRGGSATKEQLALAMYVNGEQVGSYSTLEVAGSADNVDASVSHYSAFGEVEGFGRNDDEEGFLASRVDGVKLFFDLSGKMHIVDDAPCP